MEMFAPDLMSSKDRDSFIRWYNERAQSGEEFNLKREMVSYCSDDVEILRQSSRIFRNMYLHEFDVDPFVDCSTIASTCMRVYRKNFLKEEQIGLIPPTGYRGADTHSKKSLQWIMYMDKKVLKRPVQHAGKCREKRTILGIPVDGFCEPLASEDHLGIVLSFLGCFWHGCEKKIQAK